MKKDLFFNKKHSFDFDILKIILAALCWTLAIYYMIWSQNYFSGVDAYYHVELAEIMRKYGLVLNGFPWANCSIWRDHFFDKEWLFHIYLIPFLYFGKLLGGKIAILVSTFLICVGWGFLLKTLKVKHIFFFLILMICCAGYAFASRLTMCRAHLLSIAILPICFICIIKQKRLLFFIVSLIYSFTYTGAWQVIPLAFLFDLLRIIYYRDFKIKNMMFLPAVLGVTAGILLNPYFPNNINGLFVQNFIVLKSKWLGQTNVALSMGNELNPVSNRRLFTQFLPFFLLLFVTCGNLYKNRKSTEIQVVYFGLVAAGYFVVTLMSIKFSDYSLAIGVTFAAAFWDKWILQIREKWKYGIAVLLIAYSSLFYYAISVFLETKGMPDRYSVQYSGATKWLVNNLPENEKNNIMNPKSIVFTGGWDDAPMLFYGAPQYRYLVFLDPCFMYSYSPKVYRDWQRISDGTALYSALLIHQKFHAKFVFLTSRYNRLIELLEKSPSAKLCYTGTEGEKIFKIEVSEKELREHNRLIEYYEKHIKKSKKKKIKILKQ